MTLVILAERFDLVLRNFFPGGCGCAKQPSIVSRRCVKDWNSSLRFRPNVSARRVSEAFPVSAIAQTEAASDNDGVGIKNVDQGADCGAQSMSGGAQYLKRICVPVCCRRKYVASTLRNTRAN